MRTFLLVATAMVAFAANSVLNRLGVSQFGMDPLAFAGLRLVAGAGTLLALMLWRGGWPRFSRARIAAALALLMYMAPFSIAYVILPTGVGALILFGAVQCTMFAGAALMGQSTTGRQWGGMAVAMAGLAWLMWPHPGAASVQLASALVMGIAGLSWGLFSLIGRGSRDPLGDMAVSFLLVLPFALGLLGLAPTLATPWGGYAAALTSGAVMSGLGYALWYHVLPRIPATTAAVAQLSVPVIAVLAGALLLDEALTLEVLVTSAVVLGGIAVAVARR
ncbi:DMT family transporter [Thalassorhabdomicrobium marinisediminis]|uniref:DMT family transporter n=1 Tax=Thalassorhabdomicrobium marinisediminis TaxID=2170577 RepID=UPI0024924D9F|nr:DMT family transporter [Thalassorhabdomicrobium marinisediminis]